MHFQLVLHVVTTWIFIWFSMSFYRTTRLSSWFGTSTCIFSWFSAGFARRSIERHAFSVGFSCRCVERCAFQLKDMHFQRVLHVLRIKLHTFSAETACRTTELTENACRSIVQRHANQPKTYVVHNWFGMSFYRTTWIFSCVYISFYRTTCPNS